MLLIIAICIRGQLSCEGGHKEFLAITIVKDQVLEGGLNNDSGKKKQKKNQQKKTMIVGLSVKAQSFPESRSRISAYSHIWVHCYVLDGMFSTVSHRNRDLNWLKWIRNLVSLLKHPEAGQVQDPGSISILALPSARLVLQAGFSQGFKMAASRNFHHLLPYLCLWKRNRTSCPTPSMGWKSFLSVYLDQ